MKDGPSFFFAQTINNEQPLRTGSVPVLTLCVFAESSQTVAKLDASTQIVCDATSAPYSLNIELYRNGTFITSHLVQLEESSAHMENGFLVATDNLTWADTPDEGINMYQLTITVLDEGSEPDLQGSVFAGTRSLNATVFP